MNIYQYITVKHIIMLAIIIFAAHGFLLASNALAEQTFFPAADDLAAKNSSNISDVSEKAKQPVFMSLKSNEVLMRVGPGKIYPAIWQYQVRGLPMQVVGQHNNEWLQVKDVDGETGWIYARLLSSARTGMVMYDNVLLHHNPDNNSDVVVKLQKNVIVVPQSCRATWCDVNVPYQQKTYKGWVRKQYLWGILAGESFEE